MAGRCKLCWHQRMPLLWRFYDFVLHVFWPMTALFTQCLLSSLQELTWSQRLKQKGKCQCARRTKVHNRAHWEQTTNTPLFHLFQYNRRCFDCLCMLTDHHRGEEEGGYVHLSHPKDHESSFNPKHFLPSKLDLSALSSEFIRSQGRASQSPYL